MLQQHLCLFQLNLYDQSLLALGLRQVPQLRRIILWISRVIPPQALEVSFVSFHNRQDMQSMLFQRQQLKFLTCISIRKTATLILTSIRDPFTQKRSTNATAAITNNALCTGAGYGLLRFYSSGAASSSNSSRAAARRRRTPPPYPVAERRRLSLLLFQRRDRVWTDGYLLHSLTV